MKKGLFLIITILTFSHFIYSSNFLVNNKTDITISTPINIVECFLYNLSNINEKYFLTILTKEKEIIFADIDNSNDYFLLNNLSNIYKYERADTVQYLQTFYFNNKFYIAHLEKFSYELYLSSFSNPENINNLKIGETDINPKIFLDGIYLRCFFNEKNMNSILLKSINLNNNETNEIQGEKDISYFGVSHFKTTGDFSIIWQKNKESKNFYISTMNNKLVPYSPITLIKFNQKIEPPKMILNENYLNFVFSIDYTNYYFRYPFKNDVRNYSQIKFPEEFQNYDICNFFYLNGIYIVVATGTAPDITVVYAETP